MRTVRTADRLADAIAAARREATVAFGDDRLVIEALVEGPRHVEVQVLFDHYGTGVHLGERDCSIQRRHQKVLEEAPSPGVDGALRARLGDAALRLGAEVGYEGAGTCEFLVDDRGTFSFLEMNARLQVEHPVTEGITGRDLVADQLAIAVGSDLAALGLDQAAVDAARATGGHAIEVRLYAEDAEAGFLPSTGRIVELRWPEGAGAFRWDGDVRVDAGIDDGTEVGDRFDPMLAKLLARGATREAALDRLAAALDETVLLGLVTNLRFLRWLVRSPAVRAGQARIDTLDRTWPPDDWAERTALDDEAWATAARALASTLDADDPWSGGWRLNARGRLRVRSDDGQDRMVALDPDADDPAPTRSAATSGATVFVDVAGRSVGFGLAPPPELGRPAARGGGTEDGDTAELTAPMPGLVIAIHAAKGVLVGAGDPVVTIEAMKMEHVVAAPVAGEIADLSIDRGDQVARGQLLGRIEPPAAPER
jgi:acetyl-CoA/propionyl-CoA carboxylase biotin carboxyl carrier protein